jgi:hypothetical protein
MARRCRNMLELMYVVNGVSQSVYVGWCIDCKKMHGMNDVKLETLSAYFTITLRN